MSCKSWLVICVVAALASAGCFGAQKQPIDETETVAEAEPVPPPEAPDFDWASAIHVTHPEGIAGHALPDAHAAIVGLEAKGYSDITTGMRYKALVSGQYNEVDVCGDLAVVGSFAGNRAFTLVNITNTSEIRAQAQFASNSLNWDVRFSPDCQLVFIGMENMDLIEPGVVPAAPPAPVGGVQGETVNAAGDTGRGGVIIVDVSRPGYPERVAYVQTPTVHNLFSYEVANTTYVILDSGGIMKLTGEGDGRTLEKVAEVPGSPDIHVAVHPQTGNPYLFTGQDDLSIYDFTDPANPGFVSSLKLPDGHTMGHEQTPAPTMLDGRWVIVGAGKNQAGMPEPFSIVNITDPSEPEFLGSWILPGEFGAHDPDTAFYTFSPHNVAIRDDGRVALANYHAGTWVIDISTKERQETPATLGFAMPTPPQTDVTENAEAWASPYGIVHSLPYAPYVSGGAWAADGSLVVTDLNSGVYTYAVP